MGIQRRDLSGQRFGRLVAIETNRRDHRHNRLWRCQCDCGNEVEVNVNRLVTGNTKSCGCLYVDAHKTHGATVGRGRVPEYIAWMHMRARCTNPKLPQFKDYGGRGIRVCDRWNDYASFIADMGNRPSPRHSLDRIDVNGNYEPGNCRWATKDVQQHNRRPKSNTGIRGISWAKREQAYVWRVTRRGRFIHGKTKSLAEAIEKVAEARTTLYGEYA